jgi:hypothetical protein
MVLGSFSALCWGIILELTQNVIWVLKRLARLHYRFEPVAEFC